MLLQRQSPRGKHGRPPPRGLPHGAVTALGSWARASGSCRRRGGLGGPFRALLVVHQLPMVRGRPCAAPSLGPLAECSDRSPRLPRPRVTVRTPVGPQSCFRASFEVGVTCSSGAFSWQAFTGVTVWLPAPSACPARLQRNCVGPGSACRSSAGLQRGRGAASEAGPGRTAPCDLRRREVRRQQLRAPVCVASRGLGRSHREAGGSRPSARGGAPVRVALWGRGQVRAGRCAGRAKASRCLPRGWESPSQCSPGLAPQARPLCHGLAPLPLAPRAERGGRGSREEAGRTGPSQTGPGGLVLSASLPSLRSAPDALFLLALR